MEFDITGNLKLNTQQATQAIQSFTQNMNIPLMNGNVSNLGPIQGPLNKEDAKFENTSEKMGDLNDVMSKVKDSFKEVLESIKSFSGDLDNLSSKLPDALQKSRKDEAQNKTKKDNKELAPLQKTSKEIVTVTEAGTNTARSLANSDIVGGTTNIASTVGKGLMALGPGGIAAGTALLAGAGVAKGMDVFANKYAEALPGMELLNSTFGGENINKYSREKNSNQAYALKEQITSKSLGTGMRTEDFIRLSTSLGQYGITDFNRATNIAKQSAFWNHYTGVDTNQAANFAGMIERYGGNGIDALQKAYGAARASGLDKSQFGEFLQGLESVVENGISKGFIKSTDEVSEELANISIISGNNELWTGKNGAKRYEQMGSAMSQATSLQSTSSMLLYQAMANRKNEKGELIRPEGSWIDVMSDIEKGQWGNKAFLDSYRETLRAAYGNDKDQQIATIKENFGLNWTGAKDFYENILNPKDGKQLTQEQIDAKIEEYKTKTEYKSDTALMTDALNKLDTAIEGIGKGTFNLKYEGIDTISDDVEAIKNFLLKVDEGKGTTQVYESFEEKAKEENKKIEEGAGLYYTDRPNNWEDIIRETEDGRTSIMENNKAYIKKQYGVKDMSIIDAVKKVASFPEGDLKDKAFNILQGAFVPYDSGNSKYQDSKYGGGFNVEVFPELWKIINAFEKSVEKFEKSEIDVR